MRFSTASFLWTICRVLLSTLVNSDPGRFTFHIAKGLSDNGMGTSATVLEAVQGCIINNAKVISLSLGGEPFSPMSADVYKQAYENDGILIVAAAGNQGTNALSYPASYPHVMSVAAVDSNGNRAGFSQFNNQVVLDQGYQWNRQLPVMVVLYFLMAC